MNQKIPTHLVIIPDGNRRWARARGLIASEGHRKAGSYEHMKALFDEVRKAGIKYLSFWGFSTENWKRDKKENEEIFKLVIEAIEGWRKEAIENKIRFRHIGRKDRLPKSIIEEIDRLEKETRHFSDFNVQLCLDYGGRDELIRAINKIIRFKVGEVNEDKFSEFLDTSGLPEPDLIIRTSGEKRMSGFMPFQSAYAEMYFCDVHFPDFDACELKKALEDFSKRKRTFGG